MDVVCNLYFRGDGFRDERGRGSKFHDIDNDGFDDLLLCLRFAKNFRGAVYIWWGGQDFSGDRPADIVLVGEIRSNMGGDDIACGDFNNDGCGDVLVGGLNYPRYPIQNGRAYVFYGDKKTLMDAQVADSGYVIGLKHCFR